MSLPRSIDRVDIGAGPVSLPTTTETVVIVGPMLQTPKDTSVVVLFGQILVTLGTAGTGVTLRVRQGTTVTGPQVGQSVVQGGITAGVPQSIGFCVSLTAAVTDYVQCCVTAQQQAATGNGAANGAVLIAQSW